VSDLIDRVLELVFDAQRKRASFAVCRYCGGPDIENGEPTNSGTCGRCYYGMRMDPVGWRRELAAKGRKVEYVGGCTVARSDDGKITAIVCANPYKPAGEGEP